MEQGPEDPQADDEGVLHPAAQIPHAADPANFQIIRCFDFLNHIDEVALSRRDVVFEPAISTANGFYVAHYLGVAVSFPCAAMHAHEAKRKSPPTWPQGHGRRMRRPR